MSNILDPRFKYVPAAKTDIRRTIRREQRRLEAEAQARAESQAEAARVVTPIARRKS